MEPDRTVLAFLEESDCAFNERQAHAAVERVKILRNIALVL